jgi:formylglycine-generating enzyme required for sulfatase activity
MKNYYEILEISPNVTQEQIKKQYRFLLHAWHPDKFPESDQKTMAEEKVKLINEAYSILSDPQKRRDYDLRIGTRSSEYSRQTYASKPREEEKSYYEKAYEERVKREYYEQQRMRAEKERAEAEAIRKKKIEEERKRAEEESRKRESVKKRDPIEEERLRRENEELQQKREKEFIKLKQVIIGFFILIFFLIPLVLILSFLTNHGRQQLEIPTAENNVNITQTEIISTLTVTPTPRNNMTRIREIDGMIMLNIPASVFPMGSIIRENEQPIHDVYLDSYWIDETEVTNAQYGLCVDAGVCNSPTSTGSRSLISYFENPSYQNYPVIYVTWFDAQTYCEWVGATLPTEAQWEKAARGINANIYPWGDQFPNSSLANYDFNVGDTSRVGSYPEGTSPYGALDMTGNVAEWVADWYGVDYYAESLPENPLGIETSEYRVVRGGSWNNRVVDLRSSERSWSNPESSYDNIGFRCASSD